MLYLYHPLDAALFINFSAITPLFQAFCFGLLLKKNRPSHWVNFRFTVRITQRKNTVNYGEYTEGYYLNIYDRAEPCP